jgi:hypothetical protein
MLPVVVPSHPAVLRAARLDDLPGARLLDAGHADLGRQGAIATPEIAAEVVAGIVRAQRRSGSGQTAGAPV